MKLKGYILAALAAATYGTNPAFAVPLYGDGMNPTSVLLFRYLLSLPILLLIILGRGWNLKLNRRAGGDTRCAYGSLFARTLRIV